MASYPLPSLGDFPREDVSWTRGRTFGTGGFPETRGPDSEFTRPSDEGVEWLRRRPVGGGPTGPYSLFSRNQRSSE